MLQQEADQCRRILRDVCGASADAVADDLYPSARGALGRRDPYQVRGVSRPSIIYLSSVGWSWPPRSALSAAQGFAGRVEKLVVGKQLNFGQYGHGAASRPTAWCLHASQVG